MRTESGNAHNLYSAMDVICLLYHAWLGPMVGWVEEEETCIVDADGRGIGPGVQLDGHERKLIRVSTFASSLTHLIVPKGVTTIGDGAFKQCAWLASVTLQEGVTTIGAHAFEDCSSLVSVKIPKGVTTIESYAFVGCSSLASVELPEGVIGIGEGAFCACTSLASVSLPNSMHCLGELSFAHCHSLPEVSIPENVMTIPFEAFQNCRSLVFLNVPEGVTQVHYAAFTHCVSLVAAVLPQSCRSIQEKAFYGCRRLSLVVAQDELRVETEDEDSDSEDSVDEDSNNGGTMANVFTGCPLLTPPTYVTSHTPEAVIAAQRLEYWTPSTHQQLCHPHRRRWVFFAVILLQRAGLPRVVLLTVLTMLKRHELGPAAR